MGGHRLLVDSLTDLIHAKRLEELLQVRSNSLFNTLDHGVTALVENEEEAAHQGFRVPFNSVVGQLFDQDSYSDINRQVFPRLLYLITNSLDQGRHYFKIIEDVWRIAVEFSQEADQSFECDSRSLVKWKVFGL